MSRSRDAADQINRVNSSAADATAITIDSSENVSIGHASPTAALDVRRGDESGKIAEFHTSTGFGIELGSSQSEAYVQAGSSQALLFNTNVSNERMRITSAGDVYVGKTSSGFNDAGLELEGQGRARITRDGAVSLQLNRLNTHGDVAIFYIDGSAIGDIGTDAGRLKIGSTSGSGLRFDGAQLIPFVGTSASDNAVDLGYSSNRFRYAYIGTNLFVGKTAINNDAGGVLYANGQAYFVTGAGEATLLVNNSGGSNSTNTLIQFYRNSSGVGTVTTSGTSTSYNTSSDYRLKTDVQPMTGASDRVQALNPVNFEWIADGTRVDGFLAHEAATVVPEAITGDKDAMKDEEYEVTPAVEATFDEEGNVLTEAVDAVMGTRNVPDYQGIDQSKIVPLLTAALQEALTKIDSLETRLTALEG